MRALVLLTIPLLCVAACEPVGDGPSVAVPEQAGALKTAALERADRRLYDGAPPMIPHENMGMGCMNCHNLSGMNVPDLGFAPAMPHERTAGLSAYSNCTQCHSFQAEVPPFKGNSFAGLRQDLRHGRKGFALSPPVMPHPVFMRENCLACHAGPAAREEIRCSHPERMRCRQCHVPQATTEKFMRES